MTLRARVRSSKGFSLIEMMIAVVFIMISMLALLTATVASVRANMENEVRNTAIRLTNQTAEVLLSLPKDDVELTDSNATVGVATTHSRVDGSSVQNEKGFPPLTVSVRGFQQAFVVQWDVDERTATVKEVTINVSYEFRGKTYTNSAVIYKHGTV